MPALRVRFSSRVSAAALGVVLMAAVFGQPARAQFLGYWGWRAPPEVSNLMPAPAVYRRLLARGLDLLGPLQRNGGVYLADVRDRSGHRRRLVIDAYSGAILQSFAYGPPRPPAGIPEPRTYPQEPAYASRYAPEALPPSDEPPAFAPAPGPRLAPEPDSPPRESKAKRPPHKIARREVTPRKPKEPRQEPAPSEATREPGPPSSVAPAQSSATPKAAEREGPSARPGGASTPAARSPQEAAAGPIAPPSSVAKPITKSDSKPGNRPGYANGVPINPLD